MSDEFTQYLQEYIDKKNKRLEAAVKALKDYYPEERLDIHLHNIEGYRGFVESDLVGEENINYDTNCKLAAFLSQYNVHVSDWVNKFMGKPMCEIKNREIIKILWEDRLRDAFDPFALIWYPELTVTNERNQSEKIKDMYVRLSLGNTLRITGIRSHYTMRQFQFRYMHSHLPSFNASSGPSFKNFCFGNGPIHGTLSRLSLEMGFQDPDLWGLLFYELDNFLKRESLDGGPHVFISQLGSEDRGDCVLLGAAAHFSISPNTYKLREAAVHHIRKRGIKFAFRNGTYTLGMPFLQFWREFTKSYVEYAKWYVGHVSKNCISGFECALSDYVISGNSIYKYRRNPNLDSLDRASSLNGLELFTFKGIPVKLSIEGAPNPMMAERLLDINMVNWVLTDILKRINYEYAREEKKKGGEEGKRENKVLYCRIHD